MANDGVKLVSARKRVNLSLAVGVAVGLACAGFSPWEFTLTTGWSAMAVVLLTWTWRDVWSVDAEQTRQWAADEDNSHGAALVVMTSASSVSLVGMAFGLAKSHHVHQPWAALLTVSSVLNVVFAWLVVHTMYTLRYAHMYYREPEGGIDFHSGDAPDYHDFAYVAFTVGMSFAISDTDLLGPKFRRTVTRHALLSYLFGAIIIGATINVMAGFIH
jgi:uncharacterized membrane protein